MTQVTQLECDVCGKTAKLDGADDWWNVQLSRRGPISPPGVMDQQLMQQAVQQAQMAPPSMPGMDVPQFAAGMPGAPGAFSGFGGAGAGPPPPEPFGSPKSVDVCSPKCASDFVKDGTKLPPKPKKAEAEAEGADEE
jgi:hypothetical protein